MKAGRWVAVVALVALAACSGESLSHAAGRSPRTRTIRPLSPLHSAPAVDPVGVKRLPDVIGSCPSRPVTEVSSSRATDAAALTALTYLTTVGQWRSGSVQRAYQVGSVTDGYGAVFAYNIPRFCGATTAHATYGVELLDTSGAWHGTDSHAEVAVSHFATGWKVWAAYH